MNRKIFTLLAAALMLFTTAYYVNARSVAERSVGALVSTLPGPGVQRGMYHLQVDSIYLQVPGSSPAVYAWYPATYNPNVADDYVTWNGSGFVITTIPANSTGDTLVLAATESGQVKIISANDLRLHLSADLANLNDLQASMWCVEVRQDADWGQIPTFRFINKIWNLDLDYNTANPTYVSGTGEGWMYSLGYMNGMLNNKQPLYRHQSNNNYQVVYAPLTNGMISNSGIIGVTSTTIQNFVNQTVNGMLKVSLVGVSPFVLTAEDFNTILGFRDGSELVKLNFDPETTIDNKFSYSLKAYESTGTLTGSLGFTPGDLGYLHVEAFNDAGVSQGFICNYNGAKGNANNKYNNTASIEYLNLSTRARSNDDNGNNNFSYRFVYFPSEDSLVINAYYVRHDTHIEYNNNYFIDNGDYELDANTLTQAPYYYGLYNDSIHHALIVRKQDLSDDDDISMMTVGHQPSKTRIFFGINNCDQLMIDIWVPSKGVYTIWDRRGRVLGVRVYNGSYTPQWIELEPDQECPDRIPSYQWVVEPAEDTHSMSRVKITNREFGDQAVARELIQMNNVIVKRGYYPIFRSQSQFLYSPLVPQYSGYYEPIIYSEVRGQYLDPIRVTTQCGTGEGRDYSGFRPVNSEYLADQYLGYKHFEVGKDPNNPKFGKSDDTVDATGMDYNAYAFNWLSYLGENVYIHMDELYNETLLKAVNNQKTGFQFMLGKYLREHQNEEEIYGYIRTTTGWSNLRIRDNDNQHEDFNDVNYTQTSVPILRRYYYELKVADFYYFRDGLAEQFVVLKGGKEDGTDLRNAMKYGVDDIWAEKHPFKLTNIYLRESYFIKDSDFKTPKPFNLYRHKLDPTRRIFHILLDRIEIEQIDRVTTIGGLEILDTLRADDGSRPYSLVALDVNYNTQWIQARGKTASSIDVSAFTLENYDYPLYRRLRSTRDDNATQLGDGMKPGDPVKNLDAPKTLRIYRDRNPEDYLFEDAMSQFAYNYGINFLGLSNISENPEQIAPDGTVKYNYNLFIDTAFINRGTGPIKPQYLIAVDEDVQLAQEVCYFDECGDVQWIDLDPYIMGRYLVNATDSARKVGSDGNKDYEVRDQRFIFDSNWDRLVFVPAIHANDNLYIISELEKWGVTKDMYMYESCDGRTVVDVKALYNMTRSGGLLANAARRWDNSKMLGAYYNFEHWDNYHNDVTFSLRFRQPLVQNPDFEGNDTYSNDAKRFMIESETHNRTPYGNRKIAPVQGGWVLLQNWVPVLSRTSYSDPIQQAEVWNVSNQIGWQNEKATANKVLTTEIKVIPGNGAVSILNAAGKQVTITNMLGQTLVNKAMAGNNEAVSVAKGIVAVTVEGEKAVKVIIK